MLYIRLSPGSIYSWWDEIRDTIRKGFIDYIVVHVINISSYLSSWVAVCYHFHIYLASNWKLIVMTVQYAYLYQSSCGLNFFPIAHFFRCNGQVYRGEWSVADTRYVERVAYKVLKHFTLNYKRNNKPLTMEDVTQGNRILLTLVYITSTKYFSFISYDNGLYFIHAWEGRSKSTRSTMI